MAEAIARGGGRRADRGRHLLDGRHRASALLQFARRVGVVTARRWRASRSRRWRRDSSGWAKASACDLRRSGSGRAGAHRRRARRRSRTTRANCRPGRYTVILEPAAVLDLVGPDVHGFQRHRDPRRPQFPERPHRPEALRREHHDPRRCAPSAASRRGRSMAKACRGSA